MPHSDGPLIDSRQGANTLFHNRMNLCYFYSVSVETPICQIDTREPTHLLGQEVILIDRNCIRADRDAGCHRDAVAHLEV